MISQKPICVDNFGNEIYICHWTGKTVSVIDAVITGGFIPGHNTQFLSIKDNRKTMRNSRKLFDELEANCNTCKNLTRIKSDDKHGFLYGVCENEISQHELYTSQNTIMTFHPNDPMHKVCWKSREQGV